MPKTALFPLVNIILLLVGCQAISDQMASGKTGQVYFAAPQPTKSINAFNDTVFFKMAKTLQVSNHYLIIDQEVNRVLVVDKQFNLKRVFGQPGEGPGELGKAWAAQVRDSILYIYDLNNQRFSAFNWQTGRFRGSFRNQAPFESLLNFEVDAQHKLYLGCPKCDRPIIKMDTTGKQLASFGELYKIDDLMGQTINKRNHRHVALTPDGKYLWVVSATEPIISKYTPEGELVAWLDLAPHPLFKANLAELARKRAEQTNKNLQLNLFTGIACTNELLIAIYVDRTDPKPLPCHIMVIDHTGKEMQIRQLLNLCGKGTELRLCSGLSVAPDGKSFLIQEGATGELRTYSLEPDNH